MLANETVGATELLDELRAIDEEGKAEYFVCVPANPVDTGQAEHTGAVWVWEETVKAAQARLDATLAILREHGLHAEGELGDHRPLVALSAAITHVRAGPDRHLHPSPEVSAWLGLKPSGAPGTRSRAFATRLLRRAADARSAGVA